MRIRFVTALILAMTTSAQAAPSLCQGCGNGQEAKGGGNSVPPTQCANRVTGYFRAEDKGGGNFEYQAVVSNGSGVSRNLTISPRNFPITASMMPSSVVSLPAGNVPQTFVLGRGMNGSLNRSTVGVTLDSQSGAGVSINFSNCSPR